MHAYLPLGWDDLSVVDSIIVTEGEFKGMAAMDRRSDGLRSDCGAFSGDEAFCRLMPGE